MRILHVHKYYHDQDGASRYMLDVMRLQDLAGHVTAPFAMHDPRNLPSAWEKHFVSALDTSKVRWGSGSIQQLCRAFWSREAYKKMSAMLEAFRPDIVHVHNVYTHLSPSVLAACKSYDVPVVMTVHDYALVSANYALWDERRMASIARVGGADGARRGRATPLHVIARTRFIKGSYWATVTLELIYRWHFWLGWYDRAIDVYLAPSEFVKRVLTSVGYAESKMRVMPLFAGNMQTTPLSPPFFKGGGDRSREGVLYAGRLEGYKGIDMFLQAASAFPETQFYIAGTGPCESDVIDAMQRCPNIHYLGFLSGQDLWAKMASVQLVIVPSRSPDAYGLVAIEAMACGTPVLVSDAGGLAEKVKSGVNGLIFKAGDIQDMNSTLKSALKSPKDLERMGQGALRYAKANADPDKYIGKLLEIYTDIQAPK